VEEEGLDEEEEDEASDLELDAVVEVGGGTPDPVASDKSTLVYSSIMKRRNPSNARKPIV